MADKNWGDIISRAKKTGKKMQQGGARFPGADFGKGGKGIKGGVKKLATAPARALGNVGSRLTGQFKKQEGGFAGTLKNRLNRTKKR